MTHPFHPLRGRTFVLLDRRSTWGEDRVYYHDDTGTLRRLPAAWTSLAACTPFEIISGGRSLFRLEDLLQLATLVSQMALEQAEKGHLERSDASRK